jgi:signal transduction histidine kinase/response regulator RpfG family c-di-GMP phosphodiesterase
VKLPILTVELRSEPDVVLARQRARQIAEFFRFDGREQTRIATALSEIARNAFRYAGGGQVDFAVSTDPPLLLATVSDRGPGIVQLDTILAGRYRSETGMGLGIVGARRLMDVCDIATTPGHGTTITLGKQFPRTAPAPTADAVARVAAELASQAPATPLEELLVQNKELLRTLEHVRAQKEELAQLNHELEDTNRGVVALLAELDERADDLKRASEVKSRFLSNMTHELRTPVNSIISLTRILLDRLDGPLTAEQEKQVRFVGHSAEVLSEIVNDLLDLAKVEAGKVHVKANEFGVPELFGALRGMLRPLLAQNTSVELVIEEPEGLPTLFTDESKVSQILRNFISNALKYTENGEVRVSAKPGAGDTIVFSVSDTGIGIPAEDQQRIFEEYAQLDSPLQRRTRGTGLGLPLSKRLASLLGGNLGVTSEVGRGSTFYVAIPIRFQGPPEAPLVAEATSTIDPYREAVLVIEDNREAMFVYERYLKDSSFQILPARSLRDARDWLRAVRPAAIVLDILLDGASTWNLLGELKRDPVTRDIPIVVATMVANEGRALMLGANAFGLKPIERDWLLATLTELTRQHPARSVLVIDDDPVARYLMRTQLLETAYGVLEAASGAEGIELARRKRPTCIILDLEMPHLDGFAVMDLLQKDPITREIPVIVASARNPTPSERQQLGSVRAFLSKDYPSREASRAALRAALASIGLLPELEQSASASPVSEEPHA